MASTITKHYYEVVVESESRNHIQIRFFNGDVYWFKRSDLSMYRDECKINLKCSVWADIERQLEERRKKVKLIYKEDYESYQKANG